MIAIYEGAKVYEIDVDRLYGMRRVFMSIKPVLLSVQLSASFHIQSHVETQEQLMKKFKGLNLFKS